MIPNRLLPLSLAASLTLAVGARAQSDDFAVSLTHSPTSCGLTANLSGPANGTAVLFAGPTGGAPVSTPYGTLRLSNGFVRLQSIKLSPAGTGSANFSFPNNLTVGLQAALVDSKGHLSGLSSYGEITLRRSQSGGALAGAWTTPRSGPTRVQMAIEAGPMQKLRLRAGSQGAAVKTQAIYIPQWAGWHARPLNPNRLFAVYLDGVFVGYIRI